MEISDRHIERAAEVLSEHFSGDIDRMLDCLRAYDLYGKTPSQFNDLCEQYGKDQMEAIADLCLGYPAKVWFQHLKA